MKNFENFISEKIKTDDKDYYVLYHSTDSPFFKTLNFESAQKGKENLYFNPLGNGLYCSSNEEFSRGFGKYTYYYLLPKNSKIKKVTRTSWSSTYMDIVKRTLKRFGIDYWKDVHVGDKVELNKLGNDTPINSLNEFEEWVKMIYDFENIQDVIEEIVDKKNSKYDAVWYYNTDYYQNADEIVIPINKFNPKYFHKNLPE